jgi:hypothetical protein
MSAFESFVQTELPKRGYLDSDVPQETIIVRRGPGPRQFDAITLQDGQVLAFVNGSLVGMQLAGNGIRKAIVPVTTGSTSWSVVHNFNSENAIVQCFDENKSVIFPESIKIDNANTITIQFNKAQTGTARIIFLD